MGSLQVASVCILGSDECWSHLCIAQMEQSKRCPRVRLGHGKRKNVGELK